MRKAPTIFGGPMISKAFSLLFVSILLIGCASTKITTFTDPAYRSGSAFGRILVVAEISDLKWRQKMESRFVGEFGVRGIFAIEGINLFPPTRELSDQEKIDLLLENQIDAFVLIDVGDAGVKQVYIPETGSSTQTKGTVSVYGNTATYRERKTTTTYGGYTLSKPWAQFQARLYNVSNGENAWVASAFTSGNAYASFNTILNSFCAKTVEQLITDGM